MFIDYVFEVQSCAMHQELQVALSEPRLKKRVCLPRNHGKTTQGTIGRICYEIGHNQNIRIQLVQATKDEDAGKTAKAIKSILVSDRYRQVFPEIKKATAEWGTQGFSVQRTRAGLRDPTVSCQAWNGNAGQRSDLLVGDDLENLRNAIKQPAEREAVIEAWENTWVNTMEPDARQWTFFTPWHVSGLGMKWIKDAESNPDSLLFFRKCQGTKLSPWPEKFPPEVLESRKREIGTLAYARAYLLEPTTGEDCIFDERWLDATGYVYDERKAATGAVRWMITDKAFTEKEAGLKGRGEKKVDGDSSAYLVFDVTPMGQVFCIEAAEYRAGFETHLKRIAEAAQRLGVQWAKFESNGPQKELARQEARALEPLGVRPMMMSRQVDKYTRASAVQPVVEQGRFHLRKMADGNWHPSMTKLRQQLIEFPYAAHDDLVDVAVDAMDMVVKFTQTDPWRTVSSNGQKALDVFKASHIERGLVEQDKKPDPWKDQAPPFDDMERRVAAGYLPVVDDDVWV